MKLMRALLFLTAISSALSVRSQVACTGFGDGTVSNEHISAEFSSAVVRVQDIGTAYLIDSKNGYLLTAKHVLDQLVHSQKEPKVILGEYPYSKISFHEVRPNPNYDPAKFDVSLIQLDPSNAMENVRAFDITFGPPTADSKLFAMGYPVYGQPSEIILKSSAAPYAGFFPGRTGMFETDRPTTGGDSGGVLVDESGDAVAICVNQDDDEKKGVYVPILLIRDIFEGLPASDRMQQLQAQIISGPVKPDFLKQFFRKNSRNPTNLEVFIWTQNISQSSKVLDKVSAYYKCPLMNVFADRHITEAQLTFRPNMDPTNRSTTNLVVAQRAYSVGDNEAATQFVTKSVEESSVSQLAAFIKQRAVLFRGAIEDQKSLGGAEVVQQDAIPFVATLESGGNKNYLVQWIATIAPQKSEIGHPSEPLKGWLTDTRQCKWEITTEILRKVYFIDQEGRTATEQSVSKVFSGGFHNEGSNFVFQNLRAENCGDADARYKSDLKDAHMAVSAVFLQVVREDREVVKADLSHLPNVKGVEIPPEPPSNVQGTVF
ncbi:MAG: serine protease [Terriglobales bacterium]